MKSRWMHGGLDGLSTGEELLMQQTEQNVYVSPEDRALAADWLSARRRDLDTWTRPALIQDVLSALGLDTLQTSEPGLRMWLEKATATPESLQPLLDNIQHLILENEPLCQLTADIARNGWISEDEWSRNREALALQLHVLFLMEGMTISMANSKTALKDIYRFFVNKRHTWFPGNPWVTFLFGVPASAGFFERLKLISIEPPLFNILFHTKTGDAPETEADRAHFIDRYGLSSINASCVNLADLSTRTSDTIAGLGLNILEAVLTEAQDHRPASSSTENATAGLGLIACMEHHAYESQYAIYHRLLPEGAGVTEEGNYSLIPSLQLQDRPKKVHQLFAHRAWRDLYNTWNLHFCIQQMESAFLPIKLLLPSVLGAHPECFKQLRVLSLYLFANIHLSAAPHAHPLFQSTAVFRQRDTIMQNFARINQEYAAHLLKSLCPALNKTPAMLAAEVIGHHPGLQLIRSIGRFWYASDRFRVFEQSPPTPAADTTSARSFSRFNFFRPAAPAPSTTVVTPSPDTLKQSA